MIRLFRLCRKWLNAPRLSALRQERAWAIEACQRIRKAHGKVSPVQARLQHVTAEILRLESLESL